MDDFYFEQDRFLIKENAVFEKGNKIIEVSKNKFELIELSYFDNNYLLDENFSKGLSSIRYGITYNGHYVRRDIPHLASYMDLESRFILQDIYEILIPCTIIFIILSIILFLLKIKLYKYIAVLSLVAISICGYYKFYGERVIIDKCFSTIDWKTFEKDVDVTVLYNRYGELYKPSSINYSNNLKTYTIRIRDEFSGETYKGIIQFDNNEINNAHFYKGDNQIELDLAFVGDGEFNGTDSNNNSYYAEFD